MHDLQQCFGISELIHLLSCRNGNLQNEEVPRESSMRTKKGIIPLGLCEKTIERANRRASQRDVVSVTNVICCNAWLIKCLH